MNSGNEEPSILNFQGFTLSRTPPIQLVTPCGLKSFPSKVKSSEFQEAKNFLGGKKFDKLKTQTKNIQTRLKLQKGDFKNEQKGGCGTHYKKNKVRDDYCTNYYKLLQTRVNHNMSRSPSQLDCWGHPYPKQGQNQKIVSLPKSIKKSDPFPEFPLPPKKKWKLKGWSLRSQKKQGREGKFGRPIRTHHFHFPFKGGKNRQILQGFPDCTVTAQSQSASGVGGGGLYDGKTWSISRFPKSNCKLTKRYVFRSGDLCFFYLFYYFFN